MLTAAGKRKDAEGFPEADGEQLGEHQNGELEEEEKWHEQKKVFCQEGIDAETVRGGIKDDIAGDHWYKLTSLLAGMLHHFFSLIHFKEFFYFYFYFIQ
jgi:hypothetical protein